MKKQGLILSCIVCLSLTTTAAWPGARAMAEARQASPYRKLETFARALAHIEQSHVQNADSDALIHGAIRGMLQVLDPHSAFLDPEQYRILTSDTEGRYGGIGVEIDVRDGWLTVVTVFEDTPAAAAKLEPGDRFLTIDGVGARDLPIAEALERMRGEPGTQVRVTLRRPAAEGPPEQALQAGDTLDVTLTREVIEIHPVEARVLRDRVVYVQLRTFQENTASALREALDRAVEHTARAGGVRGVLLDLRDNPGGLLSSAVLVADEFLREGVIVSTRGRGERLLREQRASAAGTRPAWPLVVLVNGYSASAAEIVAGALRDHKRAVLVGTRTFGKGSVQNVIELPDGSAIKLTTALYYTPRGTSIQAQGIVPDVEVEQLDAAGLARHGLGRDDLREATLDRHLEASAGSQRDDERPGSESFPQDYQAGIAHQILRALIAAQAP